MTKFKIGDRVIYRDCEGHEDLGVVELLTPGYCYVRFSSFEKKIWLDEDDLRKVCSREAKIHDIVQEALHILENMTEEEMSEFRKKQRERFGEELERK